LIITIAEKQAKYDELIKRDNEMQIFLDSFDNKRHEALTDHIQMENNVSDLLLRFPVLQRRTGKELPTSQGFEVLKGDLAFKEKEVEKSENTMEALIQG
jgi:intraflagellar transport protein 74